MGWRRSKCTIKVDSLMLNLAIEGHRLERICCYRSIFESNEPTKLLYHHLRLQVSEDGILLKEPFPRQALTGAVMVYCPTKTFEVVNRSMSLNILTIIYSRVNTSHNKSPMAYLAVVALQARVNILCQQSLRAI